METAKEILESKTAWKYLNAIDEPKWIVDDILSASEEYANLKSIEVLKEIKLKCSDISCEAAILSKIIELEKQLKP
jgi:hypothetical protein